MYSSFHRVHIIIQGNVNVILMKFSSLTDCSWSSHFVVVNFRCSRWQKFRKNDISFLLYRLSRHSCTIYAIHCSDVIMSAVASEITSVSIVCSTVCSGAEQRKYQGSASLVFVRGIHRWPTDSPHKGPVTQKMFPFDDVIMYHTRGYISYQLLSIHCHRHRRWL